MPEFIARVGTSDGTVLERSFTAASEEALRADLVQRDYLVLGVRRKSGLGALLPDFRGQRAGKRASGLNENYGRELLELHTLGVEDRKSVV